MEVNGYKIEFGADLRYANLQGANLRYANLRYANLQGANLRYANLRYANLQGANLQGANLQGANLRVANLRVANLQDANLQDANLRVANLQDANLQDAKLPHFQIPQEGTLTVWKKLSDNRVAKLEIPEDAKRTASLIGRKCRADRAKVLSIQDNLGTDYYDAGMGWYDRCTTYIVGEITQADKYDDDFRIECTHGIHFFLTREEAEEW